MNGNFKQFETLLDDFVKLSQLTVCSNCGNQTKLIGENRLNGNWWCPFCYHYFPYKETNNISVEVPFTKITNQLENRPKKLSQPLTTSPTATFPMDLTTGFLVPAYTADYQIERKTNDLLAQAIDFTRFGRKKGGTIWQFNLSYDDRQVSEYEVLISFADTQGKHLPFNYTDPFRGSSHICYFDSDVSPAKPVSFDGISFSVKISE